MRGRRSNPLKASDLRVPPPPVVVSLSRVPTSSFRPPQSMTPAEFMKEVNDALRLPPRIGTDAAASSPSASSERPSSVFSAPPFPGVFGGGVSALAALPLATASAVGEGFAKGAEGVAGALAGLSLGLQGGAGEGFCAPPEIIEVGGGIFLFLLSLSLSLSLWML